MSPRLLFAGLVFLVLPTCLAATRVEASFDESASHEALLRLATRVVGAENDRLTGVDRPAGVPERVSAVRLALETQAETLDARREALAAHGLAYTNAQSELSLVSVEQSRRSALVRVHERTMLTITSDAAGAPPVTVMEREHEIECSRTPDGWIAVADTILDDASLARGPGISTEPPVDLPNVEVDDSAMHPEVSRSSRVSALAADRKSVV